MFTIKRGKYYRGRYRLSDSPKWYDVPLKVEQKEIADAKLRNLVREKEAELAGLLGPKELREAARRPLSEHLTEFLADLTERKRGRSHLVHAKCRLEKILKECRWAVLADVSADGFASWRSKQTKFSAKTANDYLDHANALLNWMTRQRRATYNPLTAVRKLPKEETFRRRALTTAEFDLLVAGSGKRSLRYLFAGCTGLRRGELKQLLWSDLHLDAPQPFVELRAETTKAKRADVVPLLPQLVAALRVEKAKGLHSSGRVFPRGLPSAKTLARDLTACGIAVQDARGFRVDFHALRHTFASLLAAANVSELARMKLARHTEWKMTDRYTDPLAIPLFAEMGKLAALLPSQMASQISGKSGQNVTKDVQSEVVILSSESPATHSDCPALADSDQDWATIESGARGGTRTPMRLSTGF